MEKMWHSINVNACADVMLFQVFLVQGLDETMSWNMPVLQRTKEVPPLSLGRLFLGFALCMLIAVFACGGYYYLTRDKNSVLFFLLLSLFCFFSFGIAIGWKLFRVGMLVKHNEIIDSNNKSAERICCGWASEYISVMDFSYVFPDGVELDKFLEGEEYNVIGDKGIVFSGSMDYVTLFHDLLCSLRYKLLSLTHTEKIDIYLCVPEILSLSLWRSFSVAWRKLNLPESAVIAPAFFINGFSAQIDEWLRNDDDKFRLVVACNPLPSDDTLNLTSDGACAWLLTPKGIKKQFPIKGRIYRALNTSDNSFSSDLPRLLKYQKDATEIESLWFNIVDEKDFVNEIILACAEVNSKIMSRYVTELILGKQGVGGVWMTMTLALLKGKNKNIDNLIISRCNTQILFVHVQNISHQKEML